MLRIDRLLGFGFVVCSVACVAPSAEVGGEDPNAAVGKQEESLLGNRTYGGDCTADQKTFLEKVARYGRTAAASPAFEQCLRQKVLNSPATPLYYGKCTGDPFYSDTRQVQFDRALAAARSPNDVTMFCTGGSGNASAGIGTYGHVDPEVFHWSEWLPHVVSEDSQTRVCAAGESPGFPAKCRSGAAPWPYSQAAGAVWHEAMHTQGYGHGANTPAEADLARTNCGQTADPDWYFQDNTMPYIVGDCISAVIDGSAMSADASCSRNLETCPNGGLKLISQYGVSNASCSCVDDTVDGLGILSKQGTAVTSVERVPWGSTDMGGWRIGTADVVGDTGRFPSPGFLIRSAWGFGVMANTATSGVSLTSIAGSPWGGTLGTWTFASDQTFTVVGDVNADGVDDVLVKSPTQGILLFSMVPGGMRSLGQWAWGTAADGGWRIGASDLFVAMRGDFDGDGRADILTRSGWGVAVLGISTTGRLRTISGVPYGTRIEGGWVIGSDNTIATTGDLDGADTKSLGAPMRREFVLRSPWGIAAVGWNGSAFTTVTAAAFGSNLGGWTLASTDTIVGAVDFAGAGSDEILLRSSTGATGALSRNFFSGALTMTARSNPGTYMGWWGFNASDVIRIAAGEFDGVKGKEFLISSDWGWATIRRDGANFVATSIGASYGTLQGSWLNKKGERFLGALDFNRDNVDDVLVLSP